MTGIADQLIGNGVLAIMGGLVYVVIVLVKARMANGSSKRRSDSERPPAGPPADNCVPCRTKVEETRDTVRRMEAASVVSSKSDARQVELLGEIRDCVRDLRNAQQSATGRHPFIQPPGSGGV